MADDLETRLSAAVAERSRLSAEVQRIQGRKEAAEHALAQVESEIRSKNLDPETLDKTVTTLEAALADEVSKLEAGLAQARTTLQPYLELVS
jgi:predicted  nucleic acid-binding Zn-ribbon protein